MSSDLDDSTNKGSMFNKDFYDKMMEVHGDMRYLRKWSDEHDKLDEKRFKEAETKISWLTKIVWMGIGAISLLQIFINMGVVNAKTTDRYHASDAKRDLNEVNDRIEKLEHKGS